MSGIRGYLTSSSSSSSSSSSAWNLGPGNMTTPGGVSGISSSAKKRVRSDSEQSDSEEGNSFESDVESEIQIIASSSSSSTVSQRIKGGKEILGKLSSPLSHRLYRSTR